jgi:hypothetical protein
VIPESFEFILLALAAFRVWKFLADDTLLDPLRDRLLDLFESHPRAATYLTEFFVCPWCFGAHISLAWWVAWLIWPTGTLIVATPWALSAVVGYLATYRDD